MTIDTIRRANKAMMEKRDVESYGLPPEIVKAIQARYYTTEEINEAYRKSRLESA